MQSAVAIAITLTPKSGPTGSERSTGIRAARLHAIKRQIAENLQRPEFSVVEVATHQKITPRAVQMLFEAEGTTFTAYLREARLECARAALTSPYAAGSTITEIAFEAGFNDLSYFNRCFRRRYRLTPSEVRADPGRPPGIGN